MSQNVVALIIFLALVALAVAGTLIFSALVDRSVKRERSPAGEPARSAEDRDDAESAAGLPTGERPDEGEERR